MTLILNLDLDMVKMYLYTKNEVSMWRGSKVIAWTDIHTESWTEGWTDRQTNGQTDMTENITYPHTRVVKIKYPQLKHNACHDNTDKRMLSRCRLAETSMKHDFIQVWYKQMYTWKVCIWVFWKLQWLIPCSVLSTSFWAISWKWCRPSESAKFIRLLTKWNICTNPTENMKD